MFKCKPKPREKQEVFNMREKIVSVRVEGKVAEELRAEAIRQCANDSVILRQALLKYLRIDPERLRKEEKASD